MRTSIVCGWLAGFALLSCAGLANAEDKLYLTEYKYNDPKLYRMNVDGSKVEELNIIPSADWLPVGMEIDAENDVIYWLHGSYNAGAIRSANLDGSNMQTIVSGLTNARGLAVDLDGGKVYWSDTVDNKLYRANIDGSGKEYIVSGHQYGRPTLDLDNGHVYFGDYTDHSICRCALDGSGFETLFADNVWVADSVGLDLTNQKIYWADSDTSYVSNYIARANLDGSDFEVLHQGLGTSSGLMSLRIDLDGGQLYWVDEITAEEKGAWTSNLDGSGAERIFESPAGWNASSIVLVRDAGLLPGDVNCDGEINFGDINPFVLLLTNPSAWQAAFPGCPLLNGDINEDGQVDFGDINPFVRLLTQP